MPKLNNSGKSTGGTDMGTWTPERKIIGAAVATIAVWLIQLFASVDAPPGVEGAIAILAGYLIPNGE